MTDRQDEVVVGSIRLTPDAAGNVMISTIHKGGIIRSDRVVIERGDVTDLIRALEAAVERGWLRR